jgi:hypothetical protein
VSFQILIWLNFIVEVFPRQRIVHALGLLGMLVSLSQTFRRKKRHQCNDFKGTAHVASSQDASLKNFPDFQAPLACYMLWAMGDIMKSLKKDSIDDEVNVSGV